MLSEADPRNAHPRVRRHPAADVPPGGILFGMASPFLSSLELQWPTWLTPIAGPWKATARHNPHPSARRSD